MSLNAGDWTVIQQVIPATSQILEATVARLYKSPIGTKRWEYTRKLGAAVLVSENSKLSLVLVDLSTSTASFHYDFPNPFFYFELKPYFHSFQMDETNELGGLSFANEEEAKSFFGKLCSSVFYCDKCEASCFHGSGFDHEGTFCCSCNSDADIGVPASNRFSRSMTLPVMNPPVTNVSNKNTVTQPKPLPTKPLQKSATFNTLHQQPGPSVPNHSRLAVNENILGQAFAKNFALSGNFTRDSRSESEPNPTTTPQPVLPAKFNRGTNTSLSPPSSSNTSPYISPNSSNRSSLRSSTSGSALQGATPIVSLTPGSVPLVSILPPGMRRSQSLISPHGMANGAVMPEAMAYQYPAAANPQLQQPPVLLEDGTLTRKELKKLEKEQKEREEREKKEQKEREKKEAKQKEKERKEQKEREERERKEQKEREKKEKERLEKEKKKQKKGGIPPPMDISGPMDFQHVSSIGYNQVTHTFEIKNIPPQWKQIFRDAGITKKQLQNQETATFIYDVVVNGKQSADSVGVPRSTASTSAPLTNRPPPPPPAPAPPPMAPSLPPPQVQTPRQVPPVPHAPQLESYDDPDTPSALPEDDQPYPTSSTSSGCSTPNSSRSGLLSEIHAGVQLRKTTNENIQPTKEGSGLAETLARAMMQRRGVLQEHTEDLDDDDDWSD